MPDNTKSSAQKPQKAKRPPFHEEFAGKIIEHLQEGTAPWQIPWTPGKTPLVPHNPASGTVKAPVKAPAGSKVTVSVQMKSSEAKAGLTGTAKLVQKK